MHFQVVDDLSSVPASAWDALCSDDNPFLRHAFLHGLEVTGCVSEETGWVPQHLLAYADASRHTLLGAVPMYVKFHSYGEYVFDWSWANAYRQAGLDYYPKLLVAIPFTPVTGPRLLAAPSINGGRRLRDGLIEQTVRRARLSNASSLHWLFTDKATTEILRSRDFTIRLGNQFHWRNEGYRDFDEFLLQFNARNRKKIKRERRRVREAGISMEVLHGDDLAARHWDALYRFYRSTVMNHGAYTYLNRDFFDWIATHMGREVVVVAARSGSRLVAAALNFRGSDSLFGRYWGASRHYDSLHFETCYYSAIEYCIERGLGRFEAGAQGQHKLSRGLLPTETYSAHWLSDPRFARAVADFASGESREMRQYALEMRDHAPYRRGA